jgi:hypothetical protein
MEGIRQSLPFSIQSQLIDLATSKGGKKGFKLDFKNERRIWMKWLNGKMAKD